MMMGFGILTMLALLALSILLMAGLVVWITRVNVSGGAPQAPMMGRAAAAASAGRTCSHCGARLQPQWIHCPQCGAPAGEKADGVDTRPE